MSAKPVALDASLLRVFGADEDPITEVEARARQAFPHTRFIVWEGDPETFAFSYVGGDAEALLGYPAERWVKDPAFWADRIIHSEDRADAVAYCALATGRAADHVFEYRALTKGYDIVWLKDYVHVIVGPRRIPIRLRGLMFDISEEKWASRGFQQPASFRLPSLADLQAAA